MQTGYFLQPPAGRKSVRTNKRSFFLQKNCFGAVDLGDVFHIGITCFFFFYMTLMYFGTPTPFFLKWLYWRTRDFFVGAICMLITISFCFLGCSHYLFFLFFYFFYFLPPLYYDQTLHEALLFLFGLLSFMNREESWKQVFRSTGT